MSNNLTWTSEQYAAYQANLKGRAIKSDGGLTPLEVARSRDLIDLAKSTKLNQIAEQRLREKAGPKLNKTEQAFHQILKRRFSMGSHTVRIMPMTFTLGFDCRYTPDFSASKTIGLTSIVTFYEVKGPFIREDGMVKFKTAARMFPEFGWVLAQRSKDGVWKEESYS